MDVKISPSEKWIAFLTGIILSLFDDQDFSFHHLRDEMYFLQLHHPSD
jgi:hypothetical protein